MRLFKNKRLPVLPVFAILFGLYPVMYLWSANRTQQPAYAALPALGVTLIGVVLVFLFVFIFQRNIHRAALITVVVSLFLLSFGHIINLARQVNPDLHPGLLIAGAALVALALIFFIAERKLGSPRLTRALNLISAGLILFQVVTAAPYYIIRARAGQAAASARAPQQQLIPATNDGQKRDIYFILIDNYGRQDVMLKNGEIDNSAFIQELKERGFILPDCVQGNYPHTAPAMTSILNMDYLDKFGITEASYAKRGRYDDMAPWIQDSKVLRKFHAYGYHTVTFRGFMGLIDIQNADTYVSIDKDTSLSRRMETAAFNNLYFSTTLFHTVNEMYNIYPDLLMEKGPDYLVRYLPSDEFLEPKFDQVYQQNLYAFDALERIPFEINSPKFVYAHLYSAHWPFIHRPDGSMRLPFTEKMTKEGYQDAVAFTNQRVLKAIDSILENSETEPVIILQGDHASGWEGNVEWSGKDRMKILSAFYLPGGGDELLYDTISPVNNFRLIFRHYFGEPLEFLPDQANYLDRETRTIKVAEPTCISKPAPSRTGPPSP